MTEDFIFKINQIVGFTWAFGSLMMGIVLICYFARNWPPQFTKIRFQLVLALAVIFLTLFLREALSAYLWNADPEVMKRAAQQFRLVFVVFKVIMGGAGLLAIRALSFELYGEKLWAGIGALMATTSIIAYYLY